MELGEMKIEEVTLEINRLYKKKQEIGLTAEEQELQGKLRKRYIENVKRNFKIQLDGIEVKTK